MQKVTRLECKCINDLFQIHDSIRTEVRVYEHNQSRIRRLYAFQARDFPHTLNATYRSVRYSLLFYYILLVLRTQSINYFLHSYNNPYLVHSCLIIQSYSYSCCCVFFQLQSDRSSTVTATVSIKVLLPTI